ncbi:MAG: hypothetical protein H6814_07440 [Phycisphaeraceae bacterium]|nr:hypothetical protein [Phycisphaeraceae bacterium]
MTINTRADFFWFMPNNGTRTTVTTQIDNTQFDDHYDRTFGQYEYRLSNVNWNARLNRLSGVMYKKKYVNFPDELSDDHQEAVPVDPQSSLGDRVCFCYYPESGVAVVQFNQTGARHATLRAFMNDLFGGPFNTEPILLEDVEDRLRDATLIREFTYTLNGADGLSRVTNADAGVGHALSIMEQAHGHSVKVSVTVGHQGKGASLDTRGVKRAIRKMFGNDVVSTLKVRGKHDPESDIDPIDLLNDQIRIGIEVEEDEGRGIDIEDCINKLHRQFHSRRAEFRRRLRDQENGDGE